MTTISSRLLAAAVAIGLCSLPASAYAQDNADQDAGAPATAEPQKDESFLEKLEDDLKETTTPTDEEVDAIGTDEDADRDLY